MIWVFVAVLTLVTLAPMVLFAWRGAAQRGRQESAMELHRAQLIELDRDLAEGRLVQAEHAGAVLEVQRRLLADAGIADLAGQKSGKLPVVLTMLLVPAAAIALYLTGGVPNFPPKLDGAAEQQMAQQAEDAADPARAAQDDMMIGQLRARLKLLNPGSDKWVEGYTILGKAEYSRHRYQEAVDAWKVVLKNNFDPGLAADVGEVLTQDAGYITPEALRYFQRSAAESAPDAPWMKLVIKRLKGAAK